MPITYEVLPICPHDDTPVTESASTPGWAFCPKCGRGPWLIETLPMKKVPVVTRLQEPADESS
jgi:hypothetical protein